MKFFTISDPPLRAVIDLPTINIVQEKTTPLWSFADVHNFRIGDGNQNHVNGEQRKTPKVLIRIRKRYYGHSSTRASFEMYPGAVAPFTIMSSTASGQTTSISSQDWTNSEDVEKNHVKSNDFTFFVPVLLMISVILLLGVALLCMKRRNKLNDLRHKLVPVYHFAKGEEEEWGVLLKDTTTTN